MSGARADLWLDELAGLRAGGDELPVEVWTMRVFARKVSLPAEPVALVRALGRTRRLVAVVALYRSSEVDARAELLVSIRPDDARVLPWTGQVRVRGIAGPGHAVALTHGSHTVYCTEPVTVPPVGIRSYRNRPRRWPRSGAWDANVGSAVDGP